MNKRSVASSAVLLIVALVGVGPAHAAKTQTKTIDVQTHYTEPRGDMDGAWCTGLAPTGTPDCGVRNVGHATLTGTMWGDEYYDLTGATLSGLASGGISYEGTAYITGGVEGCGTGTFILDIIEGYADMKQYDVLTDSAPGSNKWQLRPGSGTGELTNLVSGSGMIHMTFHPVGTTGITPLEGEGDYTGTLTCRH